MAGRPQHERVQTRPTQVILADLKGLMKKVQPDFRGNVGPAVELKTAAGVKAAREAEHKRWAAGAADGPFKPAKVKEHLSLAATRPGKRCAGADGTRPRTAGTDASEGDKENATVMREILTNPYKQELNPSTKKPLINDVMSWGAGAAGADGEDGAAPAPPCARPRTSLKIFPQKFESSPGADFFDAHNVRAVRQDLEALTPRHRTALIRQIVMANPKFTADTRLTRPRTQWDPMSQLLAHGFAEPPAPKARPAAKAKAPQVKVMPLVRRANSASADRQRAWH